MMKKQHQVPEFQVIRQNEANAKFFVASYDGVPGDVKSPITSVSATNTLSKSNANGWF